MIRELLDERAQRMKWPLLFRLTPSEFDPISREPNYKQSAVDVVPLANVRHRGAGRRRVGVAERDVTRRADRERAQ